MQAERNRLPLLLQGKWQRWMRDHNDGHYANHHHDDRLDHPHSRDHHLDHDEHHHDHPGANHVDHDAAADHHDVHPAHHDDHAGTVPPRLGHNRSLRDDDPAH